ncbi:MAG: phosphatase PAP2 family protein [Aliarcobacter sp.]|nr:phosphatase PAP2 family protein [Aliarcobacter sp.]
MIDFLKKDSLKLILINILGLYLFAKMTEDVLNSELITKIDLWVYEHITNLYSPTFSKIIVFISWLNNLSQIIFISILFLVYLFYKKMYPQIIFFTISMLGSGLLFALIKEIVKRERPLSNIIEIGGYSFPSGHATLSTTLTFCIYLIFKDKVKYKKSFVLILISYPLVISFSRVYLHVHYLSDVIAGIGLGLVWVSLIYLIFIFKNKEKNETKI